MLEACNPVGYIACCAAVRDADFRSLASRIQASTLVLAGSLDPVSTPDDCRALAAQIPAAEYIELPAAHLAAVECPEKFAAAIRSFVADR